jgi:hypothetical protein
MGERVQIIRQCKHKDTRDDELIIVESRRLDRFTIIRQAILISTCKRCATQLNEYVAGGYLQPMK